MKILIVIAHPNPNSYNHAILSSIDSMFKNRGIKTEIYDLYHENFDPILRLDELPDNAPLDTDISKHLNSLLSADGLVIIHPNWWGQPPAILRGWVDRVFRNGHAYNFHPDGVKNNLKLNSAFIINTSNTPQEQELELYGDPLDTIWKRSVFGFIGVQDIERKLLSPIISASPETLKKWLEETATQVVHFFDK